MRKPIVWSLAVFGLVCALVAAVVIGIHFLTGASTAAIGAECTVPVGDPPLGTAVAAASSAVGAVVISVKPVTVYLSATQLQHASVINAVGLARGVPQRARIIALATAYQESGLRNLPNGDRDSLGLFQQRPSQGWGSTAQILDPVYAAGKFYDALAKVSGWQQMSLTKAAQAVQFSGFPGAYAKWESQASTLAVALGGSQPIALSCRVGAQAPTADAPTRPDLAGTGSATASLTAALAAAQAELGGLEVLTSAGSHALVTVSAPGVGAGQAARALAAWAVAHGTGFGITEVTVGGQGWTDHRWSQAGSVLPTGQVLISTS